MYIETGQWGLANSGCVCMRLRDSDRAVLFGRNRAKSVASLLAKFLRWHKNYGTCYRLKLKEHYTVLFDDILFKNNNNNSNISSW